MRNSKIMRASPPEDWAPRIILLNGPPGSGKDTLGPVLARAYGGLTLNKFSAPIKAAVCDLFDMKPADIEQYKDAPTPILQGRSYRQLQIDLGTWARHTYGEEMFALLAARRFMRNWKRNYRGAVFTDLGFPIEAQVLSELLPSRRMVITRVIRAGTTFANDSRGYVDGERFGVPTFDIHNDGTPEETVDTIKRVIQDIEDPLGAGDDV